MFASGSWISLNIHHSISSLAQGPVMTIHLRTLGCMLVIMSRVPFIRPNPMLKLWGQTIGMPSFNVKLCSGKPGKEIFVRISGGKGSSTSSQQLSIDVDNNTYPGMREMQARLTL
jgi:hypothetical protein